MSFKLLEPILQNGYNLFCAASKKIPVSSRIACWSLQTEMKFSSEKMKGSVTDERKLKELLDKASPLKPTPEAESFWATSPYVEGTVFRDDEESEEKELEINETKSVILFPGQGNQFVGMPKNLLKYSVVKDMFDSASDVLGYDLLKVCMEGPEEKLNETKYCQPATFVCSLASLEKLKDEKPWAINNCVAVCGYSLGELSALVFAGCFSFEKGINLVKIRAEAMDICSKTAPGGMLTILYGTTHKLSNALADAIEHCKLEGIDNPQCAVASYLFPGCKVIAGNIEALNFIAGNLRKYGLKKCSKLPVSGAFHTDLMKDAAEPFEVALRKTKINEPAIRIYSNVTGKAYTDAKDILKYLPRQIYRPVKWEQIMHTIYSRPPGTGFPFSYECGPGQSLSVLLKKVNHLASQSCYAVKL